MLRCIYGKHGNLLRNHVETRLCGITRRFVSSQRNHAQPTAPTQTQPSDTEKRNLLESVLGFETTKTQAFANVLQGKATAADVRHGRDNETVEQALRKKPTRSSERRRHRSNLPSVDPALNRALTTWFDPSASVPSVDARGEKIRHSLLALLGTLPDKVAREAVCHSVCDSLSPAWRMDRSRYRDKGESASVAATLDTLTGGEGVLEAVVLETLLHSTTAIVESAASASGARAEEFFAHLSEILSIVEATNAAKQMTESENDTSSCGEHAMWLAHSTAALRRIQQGLTSCPPEAPSSGRKADVVESVNRLLLQELEALERYVRDTVASPPANMDADPDLCLSQLKVVLSQAERWAAAADTGKGTKGKRLNKLTSVTRTQGAIQGTAVHLARLLTAVSSVLQSQSHASALSPAASGLCFTAMIFAEQQLWQRGLLPHTTHSSAWYAPGVSAVTHRTIHTSLNLYLDSLEKMLSATDKERQRMSEESCIACLVRTRSSVLSLLVEAHRALVASASVLASATSTLTSAAARHRDWMDVLPIITRLGLSVDLAVAIATSGELRWAWSLPTSLRHLGPSEATPLVPGVHHAGKATGPAALSEHHDAWNALLSSCDSLRTESSELVYTVVSKLVQQELASPQEKPHRPSHLPPSQLFLSKMKVHYPSLARCHYLCTQGLRRGNVEVHRRLLRSFTQVFLLLHSVSTMRDRPQRGDASNGKGSPEHALVCGTSLGQAVEVSFFVSLYVTRLVPRSTDNGSPASSAVAASVDTEAVDAYIATTFHHLGHSTAKQLRHLRTRGILHFFPGQLVDRQTMTTDAQVWRRHVQSTLATVHAHVVHPSLLWMPLTQLQEMVFLFESHSHLFYNRADTNSVASIAAENPTASLASLSARVASEGFDSEDLETTSHENALSASIPPSSVSKTFTRARVTLPGVDATDTELSRVHEYLVLRLYVVSNIMRAYRDVVADEVRSHGVDGSTVGQEGEVPRSHEAGDKVLKFLTSLDALAAREPASEREKRRERRKWARNIAEALHHDYSPLPAATEGIPCPMRGGSASAKTSRAVLPDSTSAVLRVLSRSESTVSRALASHLFINAIADMRRRPATKAALQLSPMRRVDHGEMENTQQDSDEEEAHWPTQSNAEDGAHSGKNSVPHGRVTDLLVTRPRLSESLGFTLDAATARVTNAATEDDLARPSPFAAAVVEAGLDVGTILGWRIVAVDGQTVHTGREVGEQVRGKVSFTLRLQGD